MKNLIVKVFLHALTCGFSSAFFLYKETQKKSKITEELVESNDQLRQCQEALEKCQESHEQLKVAATTKIKSLEENITKYKSGFEDLKAKAQQKINQLTTLVNEQQTRLKKWQVIVDAEAEAKRVLDEAQKSADQLRIFAADLVKNAELNAAEIISNANVEAEAINKNSLKLQQQAEKALEGAKEKASQKLEQANESIRQLQEKAKSDAKTLVELAKHEAQDIRARSSTLLRSAQSQVDTILKDAESQAKDIAADAWDAKKNGDKYKKLIAAIKNEINGYGDEYIVPVHSLLDELAEDVGYSEAGKKLKQARDRVKEMVRDGLASTCDYVEKNRRETAIRFVTDAFNGKVDSILAKVKSDNYGKLAQQIKDSFAIVNGNGEAFRDARIREDFLDARLDELKAACTSHEIKKLEAEEQRRIKEQIREEQKARREYEKAIKAAAKEEDAMRKLEAKLREQMEEEAAEERRRLEEASVEEREQLEREYAALKQKNDTELAEIRTKMQELEERGQRALSMAQQTKKGHVYVISNIGSFGEQVFKIGLTRRLNPNERVKELGDSSVPFNFDIHAMIEAEDAPALEHQLHKHFALNQVNKANHRKEFFRCDLTKIRDEVEALGLTATWTMTAAAQEYRETIAIEKRIAEDPLASEKWINRQLELEDMEQEEDDRLAVTA